MRLIKKALTFDDVLLVPAYSEVLPRDTSLLTRFTRDITLNIPLVSAAMDTVTEARLAIAMAQEGGIGIIHKNLTADAQAREVARVKRHEFGIVIDPVTVTPTMKVRDAINLQRQHGISGLPVVEAGKLVGIVTNRDLRFEDRLDLPLRDVMTPQERLITMHEGATLDEAQALMHRHRLERVLIVNDGFELRGLATVKDIVKNTEHPMASKDAQGQLRVGAAVGVGAGTEERVEKLVAAGVDVLIVDTVIYSFWLLLIFSSVTVSDRFNRWTKADTSKLSVAEADDEDDEAAAQREFARAPSSRSLHDVALAPPTITARPKERRPTSTRPKPSPARQRILDEERQRVIELYRAQKRA